MNNRAKVKTILPTDKTGEVVLLNTPEIRNAICRMLWNIENTDVCPSIARIKICDKRYMLNIDGKDVFYYDRHHHYPNKKDHMYAIYEYLQAVKEILININNKKSYYAPEPELPVREKWVIREMREWLLKKFPKLSKNRINFHKKK